MVFTEAISRLTWTRRVRLTASTTSAALLVGGLRQRLASCLLWYNWDMEEESGDSEATQAGGSSLYSSPGAVDQRGMQNGEDAAVRPAQLMRLRTLVERFKVEGNFGGNAGNEVSERREFLACCGSLARDALCSPWHDCFNV